MDEDRGYPCGCFTKENEGRACRVARSLFEDVISAYYKAARTNAREDQDEYVSANEVYLAHFREPMGVA